MRADQSTQEALSALMDGEASELDIARVLKGLGSDPQLREQWRSQQAISSALQSRRAPALKIDISDAVRAELEGSAKQRNWGKNPLVGLAVAASVTMAVVFGGQQMLGQTGAGPVNALPGGIVPLQGGAPIQASFSNTSHKSQPVVIEQPQQQAVAPVTLEYERIARAQAKRLGEIHAQASASVQPVPMLPFVRMPEHATQ